MLDVEDSETLTVPLVVGLVVCDSEAEPVPQELGLVLMVVLGL